MTVWAETQGRSKFPAFTWSSIPELPLFHGWLPAQLPPKPCAPRAFSISSAPKQISQQQSEGTC